MFRPPIARACRAAMLMLAAVLAAAVADAQGAAEGTPQWVVERWYGREAWAERRDTPDGLERHGESTPGAAL